MKEFIGKNPSFKVVWSFVDQTYSVYKDDRFLILRYQYSDIRCYLN